METIKTRRSIRKYQKRRQRPSETTAGRGRAHTNHGQPAAIQRGSHTQQRNKGAVGTRTL